MSEDYIGDNSESNEEACIVEAEKNGYSEEQANLCDDGDLKCINCPFRRVNQ